MTTHLSRIQSIFFPLLAFLIPWHTTYVIREGRLEGLLGVWTGGTLQIFALDLFVLFLIVMTLALSRKNASYPKLPFLERAILASLCAAAMLSVLFSQDVLASLFGALRVCEGVGVYWIARTAVSPIQSVALWWVIGACIQSAMAIAQFAAQQIDANTWLGISFHSSKALGDSVVESADTRWLRAYGSFPHPNLLAIYLAFGLASAFFLVSRAEKKITHYALVVASALLSAGLFFTFSRESWLSLAVSGSVLAIAVALARLRTGRQYPRSLFSPVLVCVLASAITITSLSVTWWEPLSVRLGVSGWHRLEQRSFSDRAEGVRSALSGALPHLEGVGMAGFTKTIAQEKKDPKKFYASEYQPVHVVPLLVLVETGIAGLLALLSFLAYRFFRLGRECAPLCLAAVPLLVIPLATDHYYWTAISGLLIWWLGMGAFCQKGS